MIIIKNISKPFGDKELMNRFSTGMEFTFRKEILDNYAKYKSQIDINFVKVCHAIIDLDDVTEINLGNEDKLIRLKSLSYLKKAIIYTQNLGILYLVCHFGFDNTTEWFKRAKSNIIELAKFADDHGVILCSENVYDSDSSLWDYLKTSVSPNFKFCFDTGHFNVYSKVSLEEFLNGFEDDVVIVHINDNFGDVDSHNPLGKGTFNFRKLFKLNIFSKFITIELLNSADIVQTYNKLVRLNNDCSNNSRT